MGKLKFDWDSQNFDLFFQKQLEGKDVDAEFDLPKETINKLLKGGGDAGTYSTSKMSGLEKIFVLWRSLGKKVYLAVEDDDEGIGMEEYIEIKNRNKKTPQRIFGEDGENGTLHFPITFIKANKELSDTFSYYNHFCNSPAYRHSLGVRNKKPSKLSQWKKEMKYIARMMLNYEAIKNKSALKLGLDISEVYVLYYLYDEEEKTSAKLYNDIFDRVYGTSKRSIRIAFVQLQEKQFIIRHGKTSDATFKITALGIEKINDFFKKYITNI